MPTPTYNETQAQADTTKVSPLYYKKLNGIMPFASSHSKLGRHDFNKSDSAVLTPVLSRLNNYVSNNTLSKQDSIGVTAAVQSVENPSTLTWYKKGYGVGNKMQGSMNKAVSEDPVVKELNSKITGISDEDLKKLISTDFYGFSKKPISEQVVSAWKLKPSNVSTYEVLQYADFLRNSPVKIMLKKTPPVLRAKNK